MLKKNLIFDQTDFALIFIQENYRIVKIIHGVSKRQFLNGSKIQSRKMALLQYFLTFLPHIKPHWCKKCNKDEVCPTLKDQQQAFSCRYIIYLLLSDQIWNYTLHVPWDMIQEVWDAIQEVGSDLSGEVWKTMVWYERLVQCCLRPDFNDWPAPINNLD